MSIAVPPARTSAHPRDQPGEHTTAAPLRDDARSAGDARAARRPLLAAGHYAASRYVRRSEPFDDLLQVASVGLLKSIDRFDPGTARR